MAILNNSNAISAGGYDINNSVRLRRSVLGSLSRTPSSTGNRQIWTWSGWVKRGLLGATQRLFEAGTNTTGESGIQFYGASNVDAIDIYYYANSYQWELTTTQLFRDPSAWYHIVVAVDTTQATASNRIKLYVNGNQVTAFSVANYPTQNANTIFNLSGTANYLGTLGNDTANNLDGYLTEINFIDGSAKAASDFGETDTTTGSWKPKAYTGTYGTNGFYLPFTQNLTTDYAGQLNGSSQSVSLTPTTAFNFGTNSWTMESNILFTSISGNQIFFNYGYEGGLRCMVIYLAGGNLNLAYSTDGSNNTDTSLGAWTPTLNNWYHLAIVRNAGTIKAYVNGVPLSGTINIGTASIYYPGTSGAFRIGRDSTNYLAGSLSNYRIVNGTAVYTQPFVPPSSALTSITNTALLTFQNATLIDNSPNAFALTNNGSFTIASGNIVWNENIFSDASGNANNWLPNNINYSSYGTTYDAMTDVPTNTSATVANYPTLNPLSNTSTLTEANLTATNILLAGTTIATPSTGKWYFEYTQTTSIPSGSLWVGVASNTSAIADNQLQGYAYASDGRKVAYNSYTSGYGATWTNGDVIGCALDLDNQTITFYKNNTSQGTAFTSITAQPYVFALSAGGAGSTKGGSINCGQRPFAYTPPTGFVRLNTFNLPDSTIKKGNSYMDILLYSGNGGTQTITGLNFQPTLVWGKSRSNAIGHNLFDQVRGGNRQLASEVTDAEVVRAGNAVVFNSNGITLNATYCNINNSSTTNVAWNWIGGGTGSSNTSGTITSTVSVNATAGFSVVTYTGSGANATVGHGLGVAPSMIIFKQRNAVRGWPVYHKSLGASTTIYLNVTNASNADSTIFNATSPTSSVFSLGASSDTNNGNVVAYCWAEIAGFSKFGSYTGNGSADGPFVYLGFRPAFVMVKRTDAVENWAIYDDARDTYNLAGRRLLPNSSAAETADTEGLDLLSNGFKIRGTSSLFNTNGGTYIYMAFAENPFKNANAR